MQMKHGDKAKGKASKASKTSDKSPGSKAVAEKGKASSKGREAKAAGKAEIREKTGARPEKSARGGKTGPGKAVASQGNGGSRAETGDVAFGNPIVGAAFKRAVKKYPAAFRRLTD
jgi:hypothetical protein